ncbi:MAG: hypothetical protein M1825_003114 [Sarcosagium campestre]|nr:MAG: hypothetical protein M1825_003114 [Sarcosagium campestre]
MSSTATGIEAPELLTTALAQQSRSMQGLAAARSLQAQQFESGNTLFSSRTTESNHAHGLATLNHNPLKYLYESSARINTRNTSILGDSKEKAYPQYTASAGGYTVPQQQYQSQDTTLLQQQRDQLALLQNSSYPLIGENAIFASGTYPQGQAGSQKARLPLAELSNQSYFPNGYTLGPVDALQYSRSVPQAYGPGFSPESSSTDLPSLDNRRSSSGSGNDQDYPSSPMTPETPMIDAFGNIIISQSDGSLINSYGYEDDSGSHSSNPNVIQMIPASALSRLSPSYTENGEAEEVIIPAPSFRHPSQPRKSLARCLENPFGVANVYISGLHINTTDEMLLGYAQKFGKVSSSKSIVNEAGVCIKGIGFAAYKSKSDARKAIRGFYGIGYEASFAKLSMNAKLKEAADPTSTNLYCCNLPPHITKAELEGIFAGYVVESTRIISDTQGHTTGSGFARFGSRRVCDEIIAKFNGRRIGNGRYALQVRYADSPRQKQLKRMQQAGRDVRDMSYLPNPMNASRSRHGAQGFSGNEKPRRRDGSFGYSAFGHDGPSNLHGAFDSHRVGAPVMQSPIYPPGLPLGVHLGHSGFGNMHGATVPVSYRSAQAFAQAQYLYHANMMNAYNTAQHPRA